VLHANDRWWIFCPLAKVVLGVSNVSLFIHP
jgi:hypothetical protein